MIYHLLLGLYGVVCDISEALQIVCTWDDEGLVMIDPRLELASEEANGGIRHPGWCAFYTKAVPAMGILKAATDHNCKLLQDIIERSSLPD